MKLPERRTFGQAPRHFGLTKESGMSGFFFKEPTQSKGGADEMGTEGLGIHYSP
jgi:hypothetical protein